MPFFPEQLYALTYKDIASGALLESLRLNGTGAAAAVQVLATHSSIGNQDQVFLMSQIGVELVAGAGQNSVDFEVQIIDALSAATIAHLFGAVNPAVSQIFHEGRQVYLPLFPGELLAIVGNFDAGVGANAISFTATGFLIPRASIKR